jgi:NAD(P)-dependent dehydrogenase (short-subunit alcohol dehydrogenase family)
LQRPTTVPPIWVRAHEAEDLIHYGFSKQAIGAYIALRAFEFLKRGVRINAICPGPTDTPLARANADLWLSFAQDYREATGTQVHQPEQMGNAMAFINSQAASGVNGITLIVDSGHAMSSLTNAFPPGKATMDLITGRVKL